MPVMTRSDVAKLLEEGINPVFGAEYEEHPPEYPMYMNVESSEKAYEEDVMVAGLGYASEKDEGDAYAEDAGQQSYIARYTHRTIALSFLITEECVEDNLYMDVGSKYAKGLARSLRQTKEVYCANVLNRAVSAGYTGGDGVVLLSDSHPTVSAGLQSNLCGSIDFDDTALETALTKIRNLKDDRGLPVMCQAKALVGAPANEWAMRKVLESDKTPFSADNAKNVVATVFNQPPVIVTNLTDADAWFVTTSIEDGLKVYERTQIIIPKATVEPSTGNIRYRGRERFREGWTDWRGVVGSMGAA